MRILLLIISKIFIIFSQFEILDARNHTSVDKLKSKSTFLVKDKDSAINGKPTYARILIKRRL